MTVTSLFPIVQTRDLPPLVAFYERALEGVVDYAFSDAGRDVYVSMSFGAASIGIGESADVAEPAPSDPIVLWFYVDDVDAVFSDAVAAGAAIDQEPADMPWGERVARVRDVDGNLLNLGADARGSAGAGASAEAGES